MIIIATTTNICYYILPRHLNVQLVPSVHLTQCKQIHTFQPISSTLHLEVATNAGNEACYYSLCLHPASVSPFCTWCVYLSLYDCTTIPNPSVCTLWFIRWYNCTWSFIRFIPSSRHDSLYQQHIVIHTKCHYHDSPLRPYIPFILYSWICSRKNKTHRHMPTIPTRYFVWQPIPIIPTLSECCIKQWCTETFFLMFRKVLLPPQSRNLIEESIKSCFLFIIFMFRSLTGFMSLDLDSNFRKGAQNIQPTT